jgi:hypothetical protein
MPESQKDALLAQVMDRVCAASPERPSGLELLPGVK